MLRNKLILLPMLLLLTTSCGQTSAIPDSPREIEGLNFTERMETNYAEQFAIDRYEGGYSMIYTPETAYLIAPENADTPHTDDARIIRKPIGNVYLAATAAMSFFDALGSGDAIRFSGAEKDDWDIEYAQNAMENGSLLYAGKYREPDYELLLSHECPLAVESTMILHTPEVREKLEELGITVFTDYSSYEPHPLGRSEWVRVYGEMLGKAEEADALIENEAEYLPAEKNTEASKTAAFFYINSSGQAVARKPGDYISKMIEMAGGKNALKNIGSESAASTVTMEAEKFYTAAHDADFIIYNDIYGGELSSIGDLTAKSSFLADFKAVREGNVWCTRRNLYQESLKAGEIISELSAVFTGEADESSTQFLYKLGEGDDE